MGHLFINAIVGEAARFKKERYFEYVKSQELVLAKTRTFMNQSGGAITAAKRYFKVRPAEILIIQDDSDIPLGQFKLSFGRGSAGHQGIESIIKSLRTNKFHRLRIGVRSRTNVKAGEIVLRGIPKREKELLKNLFRELRIRYLQINSEAHPVAGSRRNA